MSQFISGLTAGIILTVAYLFKKHSSSNTTATPSATAADNATTTAAPAPSSSSSSKPTSNAASKAKRKEWDREKLKMILCVRNDLGMGKGKMMAQCCHAAVGVVQDLLQREPELIASWDYNGAMKIALKVNSEEELDEFQAKADALNLGNYLVVDAGHTQIPENTKTVLAIGPAPAKVLDKLTGHLKLM